MPNPPNGVLERLNYIKSFLFDPCDAPFTLYVETMLPALLEAAILWYAPVPDEIFTAWARPSKALSRYRSGRKGTRGSKGGKRGPRSIAGRIINFDTNEFIGKRLPGAELLGRGGVNWLNFTLWRIFAFTQLIGLIWLIWEVISGFFAKWFSLLYETEYCQASAITILDAYGGGYFISNTSPDNGFLALNIRKQRGPCSVTAGGGSAIGRDVKVVASVTIDGEAPPGAWLEVVMWKGFPTVGEIASINRTNISGGGTKVAGGGFTMPEGGTFGVTLRTNVFLLGLSLTEVYIQGGPQT